MVDDAEYTYEIIDNLSDARLCAQLLAEAFALHNPMAIFHQMSTHQYYDAFMMPILNEVLDERLSFLARHRLSGEIVGALVRWRYVSYIIRNIHMNQLAVHKMLLSVI